MWREFDFSLWNLHHVVKIWVFTTKFTPRGENCSFHYKIYTTWWKLQFSPQIYTTWWKFSPQIYTTWWKFSLQNLHHMVKIAVFTTFTLCGENFHHIIYTTCGENYTVKSKIGLTSLMSGLLLKIFEVVVKIIISCHLVLKNFIWYQCCL